MEGRQRIIQCVYTLYICGLRKLRARDGKPQRVLALFVSAILSVTAYPVYAQFDKSLISPSIVRVLVLLDDADYSKAKQIIPTTGVFLNPQGHILVDANVIRNAMGLLVLSGGVDPIQHGKPASVAYVNNGSGVAVLLAGGVQQQPIIWNTATVSAQARVKSVGFDDVPSQPLMVDSKVSDGLVSTVVTGQAGTQLQHNANFASGTSSGVLANDCSQAIGFNIAVPSGKSAVALSAQDIVRLLQQNNISIQVVNSACAGTNPQSQQQTLPTTQGAQSPSAVSSTAIDPVKVKEAQVLLNALGIAAGAPDGRMGAKTRSAITVFQTSRNLPADGIPSDTLLGHLRNAVQGGSSATPAPSPAVVAPTAAAQPANQAVPATPGQGGTTAGQPPVATPPSAQAPPSPATPPASPQAGLPPPVSTVATSSPPATQASTPPTQAGQPPPGNTTASPTAGSPSQFPSPGQAAPSQPASAQAAPPGAVSPTGGAPDQASPPNPQSAQTETSPQGTAQVDVPPAETVDPNKMQPWAIALLIGFVVLIVGAIGWWLIWQRRSLPNKPVERASQILRAAPLPQTDAGLGVKSSWSIYGETPDGQIVSLKFKADDLARSPQGFFIGRSSRECELVVDHDSVSRRHAKVFIAGSQLMLRDLDSANGTKLDGKAIISGRDIRLLEGARIQFGEVCLTLSGV